MHLQPLACIEPVDRKELAPLRLAVLGSTGSIGRQTLDLVKAFPERFSVTALTTNTRIEEAIEACKIVHPKILVVCNRAKGEEARKILNKILPDIEVLIGENAMNEVVVRHDVDLVVTATVGYSGLIPTLTAIEAGRDIALANKETLVVAGDYIREKIKDSTSRIFPIDSEHSAIAQCLRGEDMDSVSRLIITASGGPFRKWNVEELDQATATDALRHPNWNMGAKITIDSATMMNKAFEIIEAHYLYGLPADRITAVIHPQSIVHSMVEFEDGAIKAQLGVPDMHLPIAYALGLNNRVAGSSPRLSLDKMKELTFETPDLHKFPCLKYAGLVLEKRGNTPCVVNAANEVAVASFLNGELRYTQIPQVIDSVLEKIDYIANPEPADFIATNAQSRRVAEEIVKSLNPKK